MTNTLLRISLLFSATVALSGCAGFGWHPVEIEENVITLPGHKTGYFIYNFPADANIKVSSAVRPEATTIGDIINLVDCRCSIIIKSIDDAGNIKASFGTLPRSDAEGRWRPGMTRSNKLLTLELQYQLIDPDLPRPAIGTELPVDIWAVPAGYEGVTPELAAQAEYLRQSRIRGVYAAKEANRLAEERRIAEAKRAAEEQHWKEIEVAAANEARLENQRKQQEAQRLAEEAQAEIDRKQREATRLAAIEKRKIQAARAEAERKRRQAYLDSPAGKAETAANKATADARTKEEARLKLAAARPVPRISNADRKFLGEYAVNRVRTDLAPAICSSSTDFKLHSDTRFGVDTLDPYGNVLDVPLPSVTAKVTYLCVNNVARTKIVREDWTHAAIDREFNQVICIPNPYTEELVKRNASDCGFRSE